MIFFIRMNLGFAHFDAGLRPVFSRGGFFVKHFVT
jgi:hypothetical protein